MLLDEYKKKIDQVIKDGPFQDSWESLSQYNVPKWFTNSKFGIFIHWGVYSVPAAVNEWYCRNMYRQETPAYEHHLKTYGNQKDFGYKDFIPLFKAEKFDATQWVSLVKKSGAKYMMPVAEHTDGFQMYESEICKYNSVQMGPCKDILGLLKQEAEKQGIIFTTSSHRAEHWWFFDKGLDIDSDVSDPEYAELYGPLHRGPGDDLFHLEKGSPSTEYLEDWLVRSCEIIDKYQPNALYFDWWIQNVAFKPYVKKVAAYYYNMAARWNKEVVINYKYDAFAPGCAVIDFERSVHQNIYPFPWQCDTSVSKLSWGYIENDEFKTSNDIVCNLIDVVSKNGNMLLNIGPKADGTIPDEVQSILLKIGDWMKIHEQAIMGSHCFKVYGEGNTEIIEGFFNDHNRSPYTSEDIRFTTNNGAIYAFVLQCPKDGIVKIKTLGKNTKHFNAKIEEITLLGHNLKPEWSMCEEALTISLGNVQSDMPICFKIIIQ